jgi:DNA polymerase-3 subunit gamma/tau
VSNEVLYRKWRPRSFSEIAGQEAIVRTLLNAVAAEKISHAYLFSGPRGTGKTTAGRVLAKAVNCAGSRDGEPCNECDSCLAHLEGRALDMVELDAASNRGIDEIRNLRERANFAAMAGTEARKVYLVDEVHMLTGPAFNALLKTLEEPPPHVIFILATTEAHQMPQTVVSRCQRFDFRRIPLSAVVERLETICTAEGIACPRDGLEVIARTATGSLRDAINLLEQLADSFGPTLTFDQVQEGLDLVIDPRSRELAVHAVRAELADGLLLISLVRDDGLDLRQFQRQVLKYLRALLLVKAGAPLHEDWSSEQMEEMSAVVGGVAAGDIVATLRAFSDADLRADPLSPLPLEIALASCSMSRSVPTADPEGSPGTASSKTRSGNPTRRSTTRSESVATSRARESKRESEPNGAEVSSTDSPAQAAETAPSNGASVAPETIAADLGEARQRWEALQQRVRELQFKAGALLNSGCDIVGVTETEVVFGFKHKLHVDQIHGDGGQHLQAIQQAVDEVIGRGRTVRCIQDEGVSPRRSEKGGHLVRAVKEAGGQLLTGGG